MKTVQLSDLLHIPPKRFQLDDNDNTWLESQTSLHIFNKTTEKHNFFNRIVNSSRIIPTENVLVLDCSYSNWLPERLNNIRISSTTDLIEKLSLIMDGKVFNDHQLDLLVVENISEYFFELRLQRDHGWYHQVSHLSHAIVEKYRCNVVLTSWDSGYESGYNSRKTTKDSFVNQWLEVERVIPKRDDE